MQLDPVMEQVAQVLVQATHDALTESQYLVVAHVQKPVEELTIWVAEGHAKHAVELVQVEQDEWQAVQTLLVLL